MLRTVRVPEKFAPLFEQAQRYVTEYFADQASSPERGTVEVCGQRYVLVRAASLSVEFHAMVSALYPDPIEATRVASGLLFDVAHSMGIADAKAFAERMKVTDPIAKLSAGPIHFAHAGWAFVDISDESQPSNDGDFYLLYDHPYSFESDSWRLAEKSAHAPVCTMNAGYSSGWCEESFGLPLVATEILCRAKGDDVCRFIMAPPDRIEDHVARYRERHPHLAPRIVDYHVPAYFSTRSDPQLLRENLELERRSQARAQALAVANRELERDIAERKKTEILLRQSQELTERLIEALPGGVVHVAADGSILRANGAALQILGLSFDELSRKYVQDFETVTIFEDGSPAPASSYPVVLALATGQPQPATTLGVRRPDGEISWAVFRAIPVRDPETNAVSGAVVTFFDISERKRFEDKVRHTQKLESLGVLAGGIAHDFNNLLVAILGNASIARDLPECSADMRSLLDDVVLGARRAADLTKQMLDYAGRGRLKHERVDVAGVVREMTKLLAALIPKHVDVHVKAEDGLPLVDADSTQLRQVVMNLVTNAAEAIGESAGQVVINVSRIRATKLDLERYHGDAKPGSFVCVEVRDDGEGMDEATLSHVFDPFFTTKFHGRGLGMAAVLGIVRAHHGAIRIDSRPGEGATVSVLVPTSEARSVLEGGAGAARGTVLVVDDDAGVRTVASRALSGHGYQVITATNGAEGVRAWQERGDRLSLVLMDVTMPEMNGFEALRRIRAAGSDVPVLLCSGYEVDAARPEVAASSGVLEKPYDVATLLAAVERAIETAATRAGRGGS
ncbi:MAG TPA: ATP-binding protein [Polyangiaceae bacterium]|nr:ATP-binding protein [Polyangiaceae bacterium]